MHEILSLARSLLQRMIYGLFNKATKRSLTDVVAQPTNRTATCRALTLLFQVQRRTRFARFSVLRPQTRRDSREMK